MSDPAIDPAQVQWDTPPATAIDQTKVKWDTVPDPNADTTVAALKHLAGLTGRDVTSAMAALPNAAMDAGITARNYLGDWYNQATGQPKTPEYELPSKTFSRWQDETFGTPQNTSEKIADVVTPIALSGMAASSAAGEIAPTLATVLGGALPKTGTAAGGIAGDVAQIPASIPSRAQMTAQMLERARQNGFVMPPSSVNPSFANRTAETVAGKAATQQAASSMNQATVDRLAAQANGLNPDAPLTSAALAAVRKEAGNAYEAVRGIGEVPTDDQYLSTIANTQSRFLKTAQSFPGTKAHPIVAEADTLAQPSFDASAAVDKIGALRDSASAAFKAGDSQGGAAYKQLAGALEGQLDRAAGEKAASGDISPDLVQSFRNARQRMAIAHTTEDALNDETGHVSAQKLAKMLQNGDPLSGKLREIGEFASNFPKAIQLPEKIGSQVNALHGAIGMGALSAGAMQAIEHGSWWPLVGGVAGATVLPAARGASKAYLLGPAQAGLGKVAPALVGSPTTAAELAQALTQAKQRDQPSFEPAPAY